MGDLIRKSIGDTNQFLFLTRLQNAIFNQTVPLFAKLKPFYSENNAKNLRQEKIITTYIGQQY